MAKFKTVITTVGAAKIAAVLAGTGSIVLDSNARMAVGDGGGTLPTPDPSQTKLVKEVYRAALNTASIDARDPKNIIAELIIPPDQGGFWMREMALYDAAGTLLAVGNMAETYKPSLSEGAGRKQVIRMVIAVSDVAAVTITMDTATVMATQDYVDDKLDAHEKSRKHPDATLTAKGFTQLNSSTDSPLETQAATPKAVKAVMDATNLKAPLDSPQLTGSPIAPTAPVGTNTTQLANTAFVQTAIAALINASPGLLDTLGELAAAIGNDANFSATMAAALATKINGDECNYAGFESGDGDRPYMRFQRTDSIVHLATQYQLDAKAPLSSPALTGVPTAPTAPNGTTSTQLATTAFVQAAVTALINSSPAALDTLKELADALGNDANFATNVTNALAGKQPKDATLSNLSGKDVPGLLTYLGIGDGSGRLINVKTFTASGTYTPTAGVKFIIAEVLGGGGGGGSNAATPSAGAAAGAGGASGAYAICRDNNRGPLPVVIGAGGSGAFAAINGAGGNPGGTSSIGAVTAPGGNGGPAGIAFNVFPTGGNVASGSGNPGGNIIVGTAGSPGSYGILYSDVNATGGGGANSLYGVGGIAITINPGVGNGTMSGSHASGYGAGGGGAVSVHAAGAASSPGGNGSPGIVIVWEYA